VKITRALKCQIMFPNARGKDLLGKEGLLYALAQAMGEATDAANRAVTALWALEEGVFHRPPHPTKAGKFLSSDTLAYQCFSGKWQPTGEPMYRPKGRGLAGAVKRNLGKHVAKRLKTDLKALRRGKQALPHFKLLPLIISGSAVSISPDGRFTLQVWEGTDKKNNRIVVKPVNLPHGQKDILSRIISRIISGEYKMGDVKVYKDRRKDKWMMSVAWTGEVKAVTNGNLVAGLDLGIVTTATITYIDRDTGEKIEGYDLVNIPKTTIRAWNRVTREQRERFKFNRDEYDQRTGKGRGRKLRVVQAISDKKGRLVDSAIKETAAAVVRVCQRRGVTTLVMENLTGITDEKLRDYEALETNRQRAAARKWFLQWQQGALRSAIKTALEGAGIEVIIIDPAYTSKRCSECGIIWSSTGKTEIAKKLGLPVADLVVQKPTDSLGRVSQSKFKCSCGPEQHADRNAGYNIARTGVPLSGIPSKQDVAA